MKEITDIYFTGLRLQGQSWIDFPDEFLELVNNNLSEISNFYFGSVTLNMTQVYNVSLKETNYDSIMMYLKDCIYKHNKFMSLDNVRELTVKIKEKLKYIPDLECQNLEIRCDKGYNDQDLNFREV